MEAAAKIQAEEMGPEGSWCLSPRSSGRLFVANNLLEPSTDASSQLAFGHGRCSFSAGTPTHSEIVAILKSLPARKLKGVRLEINAEYFGATWAASEECDTPRYVGIVDKWKTKNATLMVKWDGWAQNRQTPLDSLDYDDDGMDLELKLLSYENGDAPPELHVEEEEERPAGRQCRQQPSNDEEEDDEPDVVDPDVVDCHGQEWKAVEPEGVNVDARTRPRNKPTLNRGEAPLDTIEKLFYFLLPPKWVEDGIKYTNRNLDDHDAAHMKIDKGEWLRWWGYTLAISLNTGTPVEKMWSETPLPESVLPPPRMGRHGMGKNRWQAIKTALAFGPSDDASFDADDWCFIQPMVDAFNEHMAEVINPGWMLCIDESMSAWRGKVGKRDRFKIPKLSWVPRKPEPLGAELKTTGCALLGVILRIELCKGKETHAALEFFKDKASDGVEYGHTCATTLRLVEPWFGTSRVVGGDSWFASIKTAEAVGKKGLYFVGV
jgi:hypothetical protein